MRASFYISLFALLASLAMGCGDDDDPTDAGTDGSADSSADTAEDTAEDTAPPMDWEGSPRPDVAMLEGGIVRTRVVVDGIEPPNNPVANAATPAELNKTVVLKWSASDAEGARAVFIGVPGLFGGAMSYQPLAIDMVKRSVERGEPIEFWAVDRRSNLLEDHRGMDAAEGAENAEIANGYYFKGETIDGEAFPGFERPADHLYMSEWGIATHAGDLRKVIETVGEDERAGRVFIVGHSLGASITEAFAAWRFEDGVRGSELVAGLVLLDGVLSNTALSEEEYMSGTSVGTAPAPGLTRIRETSPVIEIPILGVPAYARAEILNMRAFYDPDGIVADSGRDGLLRITLLSGIIPEMTNQAAVGLALDDASAALQFAAPSMGRLTGGEVETYENAIAMADLVRPTDAEATYTWIDGPDTDPPEYTRMEDFNRSFFEGPSNFAEWYFPSRLPIDLFAVGGGSVGEDSWQADMGLRAFDGSLIDVPIVCIAAGFVGPDRYEGMRRRVGPIAEGRPSEAFTRDDPEAFRVVDAQFLTHIDVVSAYATEANPVYEALETLLSQSASEGLVELTE